MSIDVKEGTYIYPVINLIKSSNINARNNTRFNIHVIYMWMHNNIANVHVHKSVGYKCLFIK